MFYGMGIPFNVLEASAPKPLRIRGASHARHCQAGRYTRGLLCFPTGSFKALSHSP